MGDNYDPATGQPKKKRPQREDFKVWIYGAKGLRAADFSFVGKGKSDPFCRAQIHGRPHSKVETPHLKKTLDPEWNYECKFDGIKDTDSLEFEIFDYDMLSSPDLLGKVVVPFHKFAPYFDGEFVLEETDGAQSTIQLRIEQVPRPSEDEIETRAYVTIKSAHNLRSADWGGKSDPYCVCEIVGKPRSKFQTKVLFRTLEPEWNEEDELIDYAEEDDVRFEVWDYDLVGKPDSLGWCSIHNDDFHPMGTGGFRKLYLEDCGKSAAYIEVSIEVDTPPPVPEPIDPLENITIAETQRVPFQVRNLETDRVVPLRGFTSIGRSKKLLDPQRDIIIDSNTSGDVARVHGHIKACLLPDYATWLMRVYETPKEKIALKCVDGGKYLYSYGDGRLYTNCNHLCAAGVFEIERPDPGAPVVMVKDSRGKYFVLGDGDHLVARGEGMGEPFIMNSHRDGVVSFNLQSEKTKWLISQPGQVKIWRTAGGQPHSSRFTRVDVPGGLGVAEGGGHAGCGTSVDGMAIDKDIGAPIQPGSVIRFGKNEFWVLECSALYSKSERAAAAQSRALILEEDDPAAMRELHIPTIACHDAIQSCKDWISIVRVALEWLNEPDEPPCVDCIEVTDELRRTASVHQVGVFEEQQAYDVRKILKDVRLGTTLKLRLCSDPFLLAPVLTYLEDLQKWLTSQYDSHVH